MNCLPKIICCSIALLITPFAFCQTSSDTLFTDFNIATCKPITAATSPIYFSGQHYIRYSHTKRKRKQKIELMYAYKDSLAFTRKGIILNMDYGTVLAFDMLKTDGYEKVIIFADKDYYYDSLLIRGDTLCFKEKSDDAMELTTVYPVQNDTLVVKHAERNIRHDFLYKLNFRPPLKSYLNWFADPHLDYTETYTLIKKGNAYELIKVDTNQEHISEYDYKRKKEEFANAGLSPFWIALTGLYYD